MGGVVGHVEATAGGIGEEEGGEFGGEVLAGLAPGGREVEEDVGVG